MQSKLCFGLFPILVAFTLPAFAQFDASRFASDLRASYGPALARQVFKIPAGEMAVDYAPNGHVCKIQLPAMAPEEGRPTVLSTKALDDFLLKLLPLTIRGKELRQMHEQMSLASVLWTEYENVTISESFHGSDRTGVSVKFTNEKCE